MNTNSMVNCLVGGALAVALLLSPLQLAAEEADQKAPASSSVVIPATAGPGNPVKIGLVTAGQKVTLSIGHVFWKGGGSKAGASADWHGYRNRLEKNALPWMALVAAVGKKNFLPDNKEFTFTVPADGVLVLYANDSNPNGNSGKGEVVVKIDSANSTLPK